MVSMGAGEGACPAPAHQGVGDPGVIPGRAGKLEFRVYF